jgi:hypothetical protein
MENLSGGLREAGVSQLIPWAFGPSDLLDRRPEDSSERD